MVTQRLDTQSLVAPRRWRGAVRFVAWLTIFGAIAQFSLPVIASRRIALPYEADLAHALTYEPFHLLRELIARLSGAHFNTSALLFAPLAIAIVSALFSLGGPHWRRIMLALLSLLVAAFNLFTCFSLVWAFSWDGATAGVIDTVSYIALSASLICVVAGFGFLFLALASAWRWPRLYPRSARVVARWWAALIAGGAGLLIGSYFVAWGYWRSPDDPASWSATIPIGLYFSGHSAGQINTLMPLFATPVIAALSALLAPGAPRWRLTLSLLALLAGLSSMGVCLILLGRLFVRASGSSILNTGGVVGLGASMLIIVAAFGLLSLPYPARRRAPTTRRLARSWPLKAA